MDGNVAFNLGVVDLVLIGTGALVVITLMATIMWAMRPKTRKLSTKQYNAELFKRRLALDEAGYDVLHTVLLKDSHGRVVAVDNVVRLPSSVLLVTSAPPAATGQVRANPNAGEWKYVAPDNRVATMLNPVIQLHPLIGAIRARFPLVKVRVLAVFPDSADFGGRMPRSCTRTGELMDTIRAFAREDGAPSQTIEAAWPALSVALKQSEQAQAAKSGTPPGTAKRRAVS